MLFLPGILFFFSPFLKFLTKYVYFQAPLVAQPVKEPTCDAGDPGSIPGSGRAPGGGHGNPLQHSCLESPMDRGAWRATVHGAAESDKTERLSLHF